MEIERIEEYDTIAALLYDVNCPEDLKGVRTHEGVNCGNRDNSRLNNLLSNNNNVPINTRPVITDDKVNNM